MDKPVMLLVEDSRDDEELALRALGSRGVRERVVVVRDGREAVEYLRRADAVLPAVVVLDLKLPKLDGFDVLRRIRAEPWTAALPVVVFSSSTEHADIAKSYRLGCNSYVRKPVNSVHFAAVVRALYDYWLGCNQLQSP